MRPGKTVAIPAVLLLLSLGAGVFCLTLRNPKPLRASAAQDAVPGGDNSTKPVDPRDINPEDVPNKVANFLGNLTPGATPEAAGHERNYMVSYQVDFLRKQPDAKAPEECMTYEQASGTRHGGDAALCLLRRDGGREIRSGAARGDRRSTPRSTARK